MRRRRSAKLRDHGDEFIDMNVEVDPDWAAPPTSEPAASPVASGRGAGPLGLADTVRNDAVAAAAGLTTLASAEFGGAPTMPMVPGTWDSDQSNGWRGGRDSR